MTRLQFGSTVAPQLAQDLLASSAAPPMADSPSPERAPALTLYEFEGCPFCRRVREIVTYLDLCVRIVPCARGSRHHALVMEQGGKCQFPYLVDAEVGVAMYESKEIIEHLLANYGQGAPLPSDFFSPISTATAFLPTLLRFGRGGALSESAAPERAPSLPLALYSYEGNQFCRLVREVLCELDLPYDLRSAGKGSRRRASMAALTGGSTRCPHLLDANADSQSPVATCGLTDSAAIVAYLVDRYAAPSGAPVA
jgi:anaphase-promoting complex subunit 7